MCETIPPDLLYINVKAREKKRKQPVYDILLNVNIPKVNNLVHVFLSSLLNQNTHIQIHRFFFLLYDLIVD